MNRIESNFCTFSWWILHQVLFADRFKFTGMNIEDVNFSITANSSERCRRMRRPSKILKTSAKIESHQWSSKWFGKECEKRTKNNENERHFFVPDFNSPIKRTRAKNIRMKWTELNVRNFDWITLVSQPPLNRINGEIVRIIVHLDDSRIIDWTFVDFSIFGTDKKNIVSLSMKI